MGERNQETGADHRFDLFLSSAAELCSVAKSRKTKSSFETGGIAVGPTKMEPI